MPVIQGYCTSNGKWETMSDKELVKYDLLTEIYSNKGECDWDPEFGTTIQDQIFQLKTDEVKNNIVDELRRVVENSPFLTLNDITTTELEKGWIFNLIITYLDDIPEEWQIPITEESVKEYISTGKFPLNEA